MLVGVMPNPVHENNLSGWLDWFLANTVELGTVNQRLKIRLKLVFMRITGACVQPTGSKIANFLELRG